MRLVTLVGVSIALAGCGGGKSERAEAGSVARQYIAALASGNGDEACSLLTGEATQRLLRGGLFLRLLSHRSGGPLTCPEEIKLVHALLGPERIAGLRSARVSVRSPSHGSRLAEVSEPERLFVVPMLRGAAGWLIARAVVPEAASHELLRESARLSRPKALPPLTRKTEATARAEAERGAPTPHTVTVKPLHALGDKAAAPTEAPRAKP